MVPWLWRTFKVLVSEGIHKDILLLWVFSLAVKVVALAVHAYYAFRVSQYVKCIVYSQGNSEASLPGAGNRQTSTA